MGDMVKAPQQTQGEVMQTEHVDAIIDGHEIKVPAHLMQPEQATCTDSKDQLRAVKKYNDAMVKAEKHLRVAAEALRLMYYNAGEAGYPIKGIDDQRVTLQAECRDYAIYLESIISKAGAA